MSCRWVFARTILVAVFLLGPAAAAGQSPVVLVDVNVIPMDHEGILEHQTILVEGTRISQIGPTGSVSIPANARVIAGQGAFVLPGLADMHVHFQRDAAELLLDVANGVTSVRDLSGEDEYLRWRDEITSGDRVGPNLYLASPLIDGARGKRVIAFLGAGTLGLGLVLFVVVYLLMSHFTTRPNIPRTVTVALLGAALGTAFLIVRFVIPFPDYVMGRTRVAHEYVWSRAEAARAVRDGSARYDQIKLYGNLTPGEFSAALQAAGDAGIHTVGHVPRSVGLPSVLDSGMDELAHVYFLVEEMLATTDTGVRLPESERNAAYRERLAQIVDQVRSSGIDVTATLMPLPELLEQFTDTTAFLARNDLKYRTAESVRLIRKRMAEGETIEALRSLKAHSTWGTVAAVGLYRSGVPLVLGTDASPLVAVTGFAVHDELRILVDGGLTPYEAISTATVNAARIVGEGNLWGAIAPGMRADLIVVEQNPLEDIAALSRLREVMVSGRLYDRDDLRDLLATVIERRRGT
ncbi:MAG: amidohydrolase family protein [Gemmatimonadales bacterium]